METKLKARKSLKKGICVRCGQSYAAKSAKKKYCSENCRVQYCREKKQKKQEAYISNLESKLMNQQQPQEKKITVAAATPQQQPRHHPNQTYLNFDEAAPKPPQVQGVQLTPARSALLDAMGKGGTKILKFAKNNPVKTTFFTLGGIALLIAIKRRKKG